MQRRYNKYWVYKAASPGFGEERPPCAFNGRPTVRGETPMHVEAWPSAYWKNLQFCTKLSAQRNAVSHGAFVQRPQQTPNKYRSFSARCSGTSTPYVTLRATIARNDGEAFGAEGGSGHEGLTVLHNSAGGISHCSAVGSVTE